MIEQGLTKVAVAKASTLAFPFGLLILAAGGWLVWHRRGRANPPRPRGHGPAAGRAPGEPPQGPRPRAGESTADPVATPAAAARRPKAAPTWAAPTKPAGIDEAKWALLHRIMEDNVRLREAFE